MLRRALDAGIGVGRHENGVILVNVHPSTRAIGLVDEAVCARIVPFVNLPDLLVVARRVLHTHGRLARVCLVLVVAYAELLLDSQLA